MLKILRLGNMKYTGGGGDIAYFGVKCSVVSKA